MSLTTRHFRSDEPVPINKKIEERDRKRLKAVPDPKLPPDTYSLESFNNTLTRFHIAQAMGRAEQQLRHVAEQCEALVGGRESAACIRTAIAAVNDSEDALPKEAA